MYSAKMHSSDQNIYISGAGAICKFDKIEQTMQRFHNKGLFHENEQPDLFSIGI